MTERRKYTDVVISLETSLLFMGKDIKAIKEHLGELNGHERKQDEKITRNSNNIGWIMKLGGTILTVGSIVALVLKVVGLY